MSDLADSVRPIVDADGQRTHGFIRTANGHVIVIEQPLWCYDNGQIDIRDVAHALAHTGRYGGHAKGFYSVAQHCVLASEYAEHGDKLWALMHDAPEAYMGDLVSPLKRNLPQWKVLEREWDVVIRSKFHIGAPNNNIVAQERRVKGIDLQLLGRELSDLLPFGVEDAKKVVYHEGKHPSEIAPIKDLWMPARARLEFLSAFAMLTGDQTVTTKQEAKKE